MSQSRPVDSGLDVALRPWAEGDFDLLVRLLGDAEATRYLGGPETPEKLRTRHERYVANAGPGVCYAVVVGTEQTAAGWVGYWESKWDGERVWEIGWNVVPEWQGRGVATTATRLMLDAIRAEGAHRFVHAFPSVDNAASNALSRRVGMECLGEVEVEYPPGRPMRSNDWRLDLASGAARASETP